MDGRGRRPGLSRPNRKGVRRGHGGAPAHAGVPRQPRNGPFTSYVMPPDELPLVPRCEEK